MKLRNYGENYFYRNDKGFSVIEIEKNFYTDGVYNYFRIPETTGKYSRVKIGTDPFDITNVRKHGKRISIHGYETEGHVFIYFKRKNIFQEEIWKLEGYYLRIAGFEVFVADDDLMYVGYVTDPLPEPETEFFKFYPVSHGTYMWGDTKIKIGTKEIENSIQQIFNLILKLSESGLLETLEKINKIIEDTQKPLKDTLEFNGKIYFNIKNMLEPKRHIEELEIGANTYIQISENEYILFEPMKDCGNFLKVRKE